MKFRIATFIRTVLENISRVTVTLMFSWILSANLYGQRADPRFPIIPYPVNLVAGTGSFIVTPSTAIVPDAGQLFKKEAVILAELFTSSFGRPLSQGVTGKSKPFKLVHDPAVTAVEGYRLSITTSQVVISAGSPAGMFRGIQTIRQLLPATIEGKNSGKQSSLALPAVSISDEPAFGWRGLHLDVSRHFFSIAYVKKLIDVMALYKMNKFHIHLTDDQGWRIEIKKFPKLTEEGAWRTFNNQDSVCMRQAKDNPDFNFDSQHIVQRDGKTLYGGFYTQKEMKDIVAYAAARHIEVIPEIDMPGHMMAAIKSYNQLSCDGKSYFGALFSSPICPCTPYTYQFANDIFSEIIDIFPSQYIHIGGDEVDRTYWEKSPDCKALMEKEGLKNTAELQSYFIHKMEAFFNSKGKKLIGWDEILEGGISNTAAIMYWRTWVPTAPIHAVKNGNDVIMTPGDPLYFDRQPGKNSIPEVYYFKPVPKGLSEKEAEKILGAQANVWTEYIPSEKRADYMIMPRLTALAEKLWSNQESMYSSYMSRLTTHYNRLDRLKVHYRLPDLQVVENAVFTNKTILDIKKPLNNLTIRYTTDTTLPGKNSRVFKGPMTISKSQYIRLAAFKPDGTRGDVYNLHYHKQSLANPVQVSNPANGLVCSWYKGQFRSTKEISMGHADSFLVVPGIIVPKQAESPQFALTYRGYIEVPEDGIYSFYLTSDDGSMLRIADREVVDNDGLHSSRERSGQVALKKGLHKIELDFVEGGGGYTLKLQYGKDGSEPKDIPASWFKN